MAPPPPRGPLPGAADALPVTALLAARLAERLLAGHEPPLTVTQYLALRSIREDQVPAAELARRAGVSGPAISQVLAGLGQAGLIERTPDPDDRRWHELALSADGQRVLGSAQLLLRGQFSELLEQLPHPEISALTRALPHLAAALSGSPPPRRPPPPPRPGGPPEAHGPRRHRPR